VTESTAAAHFGYEPHYFSRCLRQVSPLTFRGLINRCRIDIAREMLENSSAGITEIALACGYNSQRTFNRVFLQLEGCTPQNYRARFVKQSRKQSAQIPLHD